MRLKHVLAGGAAVLGLLAGPAAVPAFADPSPTPSSSPAGSAAPTEAGTSFRNATEIGQGVTATADASSGDYLYWSFAADPGQRPTVTATVRLPEGSAASGLASTWQLDVYDGLRRRQSCMYGASTRTAGGARSVELACVLRTVRAWAEPWANDPLPGTYYVRLTAVGLDRADAGVPVHAEVKVASKEMGGRAAVDGALSVPLVPGTAAHATTGARLFSGEPEDGWASGRWTDRWLWTAAGGLLAALAGIAGHRLTQGRGRPRHLPPGA